MKTTCHLQQFSVVFIFTLLRLDIRASATGQQEGSSGKTPVLKIVCGSLEGCKKIEGRLYWVPAQAWNPKGGCWGYREVNRRFHRGSTGYLKVHVKLHGGYIVYTCTVRCIKVAWSLHLGCMEAKWRLHGVHSCIDVAFCSIEDTSGWMEVIIRL